jgi:hypothetical protein
MWGSHCSEDVNAGLLGCDGYHRFGGGTLLQNICTQLKVHTVSQPEDHHWQLTIEQKLLQTTCDKKIYCKVKFKFTLKNK